MRRIESREEELKKLLGKLRRDIGQVYWYDTVKSTMDVGFDIADVSDMTIVVADRQTRGRGTKGRQWFSTAGSLFCSLVLTRFDIRLPYSMIASYAVCRAFRRYNGKVRLKWINDVLWENGRKISGVIAEERSKRTVIGIGANLNNLRLHNKIKNTATSYRRETGECIDIAGFLRDVTDELLSILAVVQDEGIENVMAEWESDACIKNRRVRIVDGVRELTGTAIGIDRRTGALILSTEKGEVPVYGGSLFYR